MAEQMFPLNLPTRTDEPIVIRSQWVNNRGIAILLFFCTKESIRTLSFRYQWHTELSNFFKHSLLSKCSAIYCNSVDLLERHLRLLLVTQLTIWSYSSGDSVIDLLMSWDIPETCRNCLQYTGELCVINLGGTIIFLVNQCLTGKTSGKLIWEEFTQGIQTFFSHKASLKNPKKKVTPLLIPPYGRFTKCIYYWQVITTSIEVHDFAVHHTGVDYKPLIILVLSKYLKMVAEKYKEKPLKKVAACNLQTLRVHPKKAYITTQETNQARLLLRQELSSVRLLQKVRKGKPAFQLVDEEDEAQQESIPQREDDDPDLELAKKLSLETPQEKGEGEGDDADLERAIKLSLDPAFLPQGRAPVGGVTIRDPVSEATPKLHEVVGKGKAVVTEEQVAHSLIDLSKKKRTTDQFILVRRDQTPPDSTTGPSSQPDDDTSEKVIHESSSMSDSERTESETEAAAPKGDKDQDEVDTSTVTSGVSIPVSDPENETLRSGWTRP
ncbi:hypothetical protein Tco_0408071 [Tanacetum coccineum]